MPIRQRNINPFRSQLGAELFYVRVGTITADWQDGFIVEAEYVDILELGLTWGAFTGGTTPTIACRVEYRTSGATSSLLNAAKGNTLFTGTAQSSASGGQFSQVLLPGQARALPINPTTLATGSTGLDTTKKWVAPHLSVILTGSPTNVAEVAAWMRYRVYKGEDI